jgi:hypothetical protein
MKKTKLALTRQTIVRLDPSQLRHVVGGTDQPAGGVRSICLDNSQLWDPCGGGSQGGCGSIACAPPMDTLDCPGTGNGGVGTG